MLLFAGFSLLVLLRIHPFLAVTERQSTGVLVVEGWIQVDAIRAAEVEFRAGNYSQVFVTGGPVHGALSNNIYSTSASIGAGRLKSAGVPAEKVHIVPSFIRDRDRTYSSAVALKNWFHEHGVQPRAINVATAGVHARRTRMLYRKAFGDDVSVGIVSLSDEDYEPSRWWRYSEGVKDVLMESIACAYVTLFFHP